MIELSRHSGLRVLTIGWALAAPPALAAEQFGQASIILEHNATDGDYEIVIEATAGDAGLVEFTVTSPSGAPVATVQTPAPGAREFLIETPEPADLGRIHAAFPEGDYVFRGRTVDGEMLEAGAALSHALAPRTEITSPAEGAIVPADSGVVEWRAVEQAERYAVEVENDELGFTLMVDLPRQVTRFAIPAGVLQAGTEYELGVMVATKTGNLTVVETSFETAPAP